MLRVNAKRIFKTISGLAAANIFSQGVQLAAQPWLARMYAPDQFGLVGQFTALTSIISIFGTWQIHNYLVLIKEKAEVQRMTRVGFSLTHLMSVLVLLVFLAFSSSIYGVQSNGELAVLTMILVVVICYASLLRGSLTAEGHFKEMMRYIVVRGAVIISTQFLFGKIGVAHGLIYGIILGELVAQASFLYKMLSEFQFNSFVETLSEIKKSFQQHREFMISGTMQEFISVTALMTPLYFIGRVYGNNMGGQFALAYRIIWAPFLLFVQSFSPILYHYISKLDPRQLNSSFILNPYVALLIFSIFSAISFPLMKPVFYLLFDQRWKIAGEMSSWISLWALSFVFSLPFRICYRTLNKQRVQLYVDTATLTLTAVVFMVGTIISDRQITPIVCVIAILQNLCIILLSKRFIVQNIQKLNQLNLISVNH
jgi:lipopolysaccharide exporter